MHVAVLRGDMRRPCGRHDLAAESRVRYLVVASGSSGRAHWTFSSSTRSQNNIIWECQNGGLLWPPSAAAQYGTIAALPAGICAPGFPSLYSAFIVGLLVDLGFQVRSVGLRVVDVLLNGRCGCRYTCCSSTGGSQNSWRFMIPFLRMVVRVDFCRLIVHGADSPTGNYS